MMSSQLEVQESAPARIRPVSWARAVTVVGLLVSSVGILVQRAGGVAMPAVPPALVIMVLAAMLVAIIARRWVPIAGVLAAAMEITGLIAVGAAADLLTVTVPGITAGAWMRLLGAAAAVVAGIVAVVIGKFKSRA